MRLYSMLFRCETKHFKSIANPCRSVPCSSFSKQFKSAPFLRRAGLHQAIPLPLNTRPFRFIALHSCSNLFSAFAEHRLSPRITSPPLLNIAPLRSALPRTSVSLLFTAVPFPCIALLNCSAAICNRVPSGHHFRGDLRHGSFPIRIRVVSGEPLPVFVVGIIVHSAFS